jgi:subtilisin family serine protease
MRLVRSCLLALLLLALGAAPAAAAEPTGRWLVVFEKAGTARSAALLGGVLERTGVEKAGRGVPALGVARVDGPAAAIERLRRDPAVKSVSAEWRRDLRALPNDPGVRQQQTDAPAGTPVQWWLARERFPAAWDVTRGSGAIVGVLDTGIEGDHPQLAPKIHSAEAIGVSTPATADEDGHGSHVSGIACGATDDGSGIAGAGWNCDLAVVKIPNLEDQEIVDGIFRATERGAHAINMSFGGGPESGALDSAIDFAVRRGVVLVAAADNEPVDDQGAPASQLQPGNAADIDAGRGLVVTALDFFDEQAGTGFGPQISLAAYGFYDSTFPFEGPLGLLSTYPAVTADEVPPVVICGCRETFNGDDRYAYIEGTSMAAPQVTALAAMLGRLNPALTAQEKIRIIKQTAQRSGGWSSERGWGLLDAGAAVNAARRIDRVAPESNAHARRRFRRPRRVRLGVSFGDPAGGGGLLSSGVRSYDLYMKRGRGGFRRIRAGASRSLLRLKLRRGVYRFFTRAVDQAGNREPAPARADVRVRVLRPR